MGIESQRFKYEFKTRLKGCYRLMNDRFIAKRREQAGFTRGNPRWEPTLRPGDEREGVRKEMGFELGLKMLLTHSNPCPCGNS